MNRLNRIVLLLIGALLFGVSTVLLAAEYGSEAARTAVGALSGLWPLAGPGEQATFDAGARVALGTVGAISAFIGVMLFVAEIRTAADPPAPPVLIEDQPGAETIVSADAVRMIATAVSMEAGAKESVVRLWPDRQGYDMEVSVAAAHDEDLKELTTGIRESLGREFERQQVPVRRLDVIVYDVV